MRPVVEYMSLKVLSGARPSLNTASQVLKYADQNMSYAIGISRRRTIHGRRERTPVPTPKPPAL